MRGGEVDGHDGREDRSRAELGRKTDGSRTDSREEIRHSGDTDAPDPSVPVRRYDYPVDIGAGPDVQAHRGVEGLGGVDFYITGTMDESKWYFNNRPEAPIAGIDVTLFHRFLKDGGGRNDFVIIDLRNIEEDYPTQNQLDRLQINGASHFPTTLTRDVNDRPPNTKFCGDFNQKGKNEEESKKLWEETLKDGRYPFQGINENIKLVFFHCAQSQNRTPWVASGYYKFVVSKLPDGSPKPLIVIIEKGFDGFIKEWPAPDAQISQYDSDV